MYALSCCSFTLNTFVPFSEVISTAPCIKICLTKNGSDHRERRLPKIRHKCNLNFTTFCFCGIHIYKCGYRAMPLFSPYKSWHSPMLENIILAIHAIVVTLLLPQCDDQNLAFYMSIPPYVPTLTVSGKLFRKRSCRVTSQLASCTQCDMPTV